MFETFLGSSLSRSSTYVQFNYESYTNLICPKLHVSYNKQGLCRRQSALPEYMVQLNCCTTRNENKCTIFGRNIPPIIHIPTLFPYFWQLHSLSRSTQCLLQSINQFIPCQRLFKLLQVYYLGIIRGIHSSQFGSNLGLISRSNFNEVWPNLYS